MHQRETNEPGAAPIALFAYKRLSHLRCTVEALRANELAGESELYVFSDGPRSVSEASEVCAIRSYLDTVAGFRAVHVVAHAENRGLGQSIISGVTDVCQQHGRVIVIEDDLITSPYFLRYMNDALNLYEQDSEVISIHGYSYPVAEQLPETFFLRGADCWGWATWKRGWDLFNADGAALLTELERRGMSREFDLDGAFGYTEMLRQQVAGANDSWAVRWHASAYLANKLTLYPVQSLVRNIGLDGTGTHCDSNSDYDVAALDRPVRLERLPAVENSAARAAFQRFLGQKHSPRTGAPMRWLRGMVRLGKTLVSR